MRQFKDAESVTGEPVRLRMPKVRNRTRLYYSVGEVAAQLGISSMTVYRAIDAGEFPALKVRGRVVIPIRAMEEMEAAAVAEGTLVDPAAWVEPQSH